MCVILIIYEVIYYCYENISNDNEENIINGNNNDENY